MLSGHGSDPGGSPRHPFALPAQVHDLKEQNKGRPAQCEQQRRCEHLLFQSVHLLHN